MRSQKAPGAVDDRHQVEDARRSQAGADRQECRFEKFSKGSASLRLPMARSDAQWVFDPTPPSGARSGGDIAGRAFRPEIPIFVREVLQNARDQHLADGEPVSVLFHLQHIRGRDLDAFLDALDWSTLHAHLKAASSQPNGGSIRQRLRVLQKTHELLLLCVHDGHTTGLLGGETGEGNFAALCRDRLFSHKQEETSGGTHGLGKAVLWRFSSLSTVTFCSTLSAVPESQQNPRFIGRTNLPWHQVGRVNYAGEGWFGRRAETDAGLRAESIWGAAATETSERLRLRRMNLFGSGTSIGIVGFHEPAEESHEPREIMSRIASAAAESFWASLKTEARVGRDAPTALRVRIRLDDVEEEQVADFTSVQPFVDAFERYREGNLGTSLEVPGDVVALPIPFKLPGTADGKRSAEAVAQLVVRLAESPSAGSEHLNSVACLRGAGMVVQYKSFGRLSLSARPFHAVLLTGLARDPGAPTDSDRALEAFLRAAEPPEHDQWTTTVRLKEEYQRGYRKALDDLFEAVRRALRDAVSERISTGTVGPDLLARKFPIGPREGGGRSKVPFHFRNLSGALNADGAWSFSGEVWADLERPHAWEVVIDLRFGAEDARQDGTGLIRDFAIDALGKRAGIEWRVYDGRAIVRLPPTVDRFRFTGESDPTRHPIAAELAIAELTVDGHRLEGRQ
jgi:hypothetical protein